MSRRVLSGLVLLALGVTGVAATRGNAVAATLARAALPRCPAADYTLQDFAERRGRDVIGIAWFGLRGPYECRLHTRLTFAVQRARDAFSNPDNAVGGIDGNPVEMTVDAPLTHGALVIRAWVWRNWCGPTTRRFTLLAEPRQRGDAAWTPTIGAPACRRPAVPSTLSRSSPDLRRCSADDYRVRVLPGLGYRGRIVGGAVPTLRHGPPCRLQSRLSFAVQRRSGASWQRLSDIRGNPVRMKIGLVLASATDPELFFSWWNWCGESGRFRWLAEVGGRDFSHAVSQAPPCQSTEHASKLELFLTPPPRRPG